MELREIVGRNCAPAPTAISLHRFVGSLAQLEGYITNCLNKNRPSYNFAIEGCKTKTFVAPANTAYAIPYPVCPVPAPVPCPVTPPLCNPLGTSVLDGFTGNPNCKVLSIAVIGGLNTADICGQDFDCEDGQTECLARYIKEIADANGITITAQNLLTYGFDDIDICALVTCVNSIVPLPIAPNPETKLLCGVLSEFPMGTPTTVFGKDASGACVRGTISGGGLPPVITTNVNTATPAFEILVNGTVASATPLVELTDALTGAHVGYVFP